MYYVIDCLGEPGVRKFTQEELLEQFQADEDGLPMFPFDLAASELPGTNLMCWGDKYVIIKGEIVVPEAMEVAVKFKID